MSGGRFSCYNSTLTYEMFGGGVNTRYGLDDNATYKKDIKFVRRQNRFEDKVISELIYDVMCLIHSYDWYASDDTGEESYRKDVKFFKKKWLKPLEEKYVREIIDEELADVKEELLKALLGCDE